MLLMLITLLPVAGLSVWFYLRSAPRRGSPGGRRVIDLVVLGAMGAGLVAIWLFFFRTTGQSSDRQWWPLLAFLASVAYLPIIALAGALVRHLVLHPR